MRVFKMILFSANIVQTTGRPSIWYSDRRAADRDGRAPSAAGLDVRSSPSAADRDGRSPSAASCPVRRRRPRSAPAGSSSCRAGRLCRAWRTAGSSRRRRWTSPCTCLRSSASAGVVSAGCTPASRWELQNVSAGLSTWKYLTFQTKNLKCGRL